MNKIKLRIGITSVLVSVVTLSVFATNKNIKDIAPRETMKEIVASIEVEEVNDIMEKIKDEESTDNRIIVDKTDNEVTEIESGKDVEKKVITPNRGGSLKENKTTVEDTDNSLNKYVLDVIQSYSLEEGEYPYLLNNDYENYNGVTEDLYYKGELLLKANPNGNKASHCTGITFEVFFKAMERRNKSLGIPQDDFNGMTKEELMDFVLTWYVAKGPKSESNLAVAIEKYGLGSKITNLEDLRPGDFIDLSRENNTGHAVMFQNWIREGNRIIGLRHWSSQGSTNGISYKEEYFNVKDKSGKKYGNVIIDQLYMARIGPVDKYKVY